MRVYCAKACRMMKANADLISEFGAAVMAVKLIKKRLYELLLLGLFVLDCAVLIFEL